MWNNVIHCCVCWHYISCYRSWCKQALRVFLLAFVTKPLKHDKPTMRISWTYGKTITKWTARSAQTFLVMVFSFSYVHIMSSYDYYLAVEAVETSISDCTHTHTRTPLFSPWLRLKFILPVTKPNLILRTLRFSLARLSRSLNLAFSPPSPHLYKSSGTRGHEPPLIRETKANQSAGAGWIESFTPHSDPEPGRAAAFPALATQSINYRMSWG